jgi:hypothetical protein
MRLPRLLLIALVPLVALPFSGLSSGPPAGKGLDRDSADKIAERMEKLNRAVAGLRRLGVNDLNLADVEIYLRAAAQARKHNESSGKDVAARTLAVLDRGLLRASQQARGERPWLAQAGEVVARGYRSRIDGSLQPYAVTLPADYGSIKGKRYRLDVVLHSRNDNLNEVAFLYDHRGDKPAPRDLDHVSLEVFGRGNNGYRWAGESDVFEAIENFLGVDAMQRPDGSQVDTSRAVIRGFSMGGAGAWHIGLHRPSSWCAVSPGAGFTSTHGYVKGLPAKLPGYQEACLRIYDAADYAANAFDVPVVAYAGADDPQIQAARTVQARLKPLGRDIKLLVAPSVKHALPAEWERKLDAEIARIAARPRPDYVPKVYFVTYTLKYPSCQWVEILGLEKHYHKALVEAEHVENGWTVKTANVRALHLHLWPGATREQVTVNIDGQKLDRVLPYAARGGDLHVYLEKRGDKWAAALPERLYTERLRKPQKTSNLQGPIDDAFSAPFLCVRGTRQAWHEAPEDYARDNLARFRTEWSKFFRGDLPVKNDVDVTAEDIATRHLVLFGDPASNSLIEQVLPGLPLGWTKKAVSLAGKDYDAAKHVPALIYPSPLTPDRYVVLNSGHTFRAADLRGSNALLYPRLGDYGLLRLTPTKDNPLAVEVVAAGLFDDYWQFPVRR